MECEQREMRVVHNAVSEKKESEINVLDFVK